MPFCPSCKTEQSTRKKGRCPNCGVPITLDRGEWLLGDPEMVQKFIKFWDKKQKAKLNVDFFISRRSLAYSMETKFASRLLTDAGSEEVAYEALSLYYIDKRFNWSNTSSLRFFYNSWSSATSLAKKRLEKAKKEAESSRKAIEDMPTLEIFKRIYD